MRLEVLRKLFFKLIRFQRLMYSLLMVLLSGSVYGNSDKYPILGFYLERNLSYSIDYHQNATKSCRIDFEVDAEKNLESAKVKRSEKIKNWCEQDTVFYKFKKLKISGCGWENQVPDSPIRGLGPVVESFKKEIIVRNLEVVFKKQIMTCRGELVIPGEKKSVPIEGMCAPIASAKVNTQGLADFKSNPVVGFLTATNRSNSLQKSIDSSLIIENEKLSFNMNIAIPVPWKVSQDISYLLSAQGLKKCESLQAKRKISSQ